MRRGNTTKPQKDYLLHLLHCGGERGGGERERERERNVKSQNSQLREVKTEFEAIKRSQFTMSGQQSGGQVTEPPIVTLFFCFE